VYTPLEMLGETQRAAETMGGRTLPFQGCGLQQEAEQLAGLKTPEAEKEGQEQENPVLQVPPMPTRYLRRRYQALMRRLPTATAQVSSKGKLAFELKVADGAIATDRDSPIPRASTASIEWWTANPITPEPSSKSKDKDSQTVDERS